VAEVELPGLEELEDKRDKAFSRRVALTTAIYAVALAIAQQQSSDQWAFYQAKVIREHQYRAQKLMLEAQLTEPSSLKGPERARFEALARTFADEEKRYNAEKKDLEKDARKLEKERDHHRAKDPYFDYAEVLLQIGIVTASVSILSASRPMFWFSLALAILGALLTINGFTLLVKVPLLHEAH
jgi:hypothetical protein